MKAPNTPEVGAAAGGSRGFSLIEMMISVAILSVILGVMMMFMGRLQERYVAEQRVSGVNETGKTAMELLALDIGQAGFPGIVSTTTTQAVTGSNSAVGVTLGNMNGIYPGRVLTVDTGSNSESVRVISCGTTAATSNICTPGQASNSVNGVFKITHASNVPVGGSMNPLPEGILFDLTDTSTTTPCPSFTSNQRCLRIIGDLRGDGTLRYIEYRFTADVNAPTTCTGRLVRSDSDAYASIQSPEVTIADNLCNTSTVGVFTYTTPCQTGVTAPTYVIFNKTDGTPGTAPCPPPGTYSYRDMLGNLITRTFCYITNIGVTLTMRTQAAVERGAGAGGARTIVFKEQYFSPRNVVDALILDDEGLQTLLPVAPRTALAALPAAP